MWKEYRIIDCLRKRYYANLREGEMLVGLQKKRLSEQFGDSEQTLEA
jgi:hypothetical protein